MMSMEKEEGSETEGSENTESTENTEEIADEDQEKDEDGPKEDPSEQILIEQDFEFIPDIWYRVVIEFEQHKIRV